MPLPRLNEQEMVAKYNQASLEASTAGDVEAFNRQAEADTTDVAVYAGREGGSE